ncbi:hypothetical protein V6N11_046739 [Hibiscus sabdariffa]|uniref:YbaK/aminoacyl-tRNA synthetase-associated domain-containing protein n=1 Tax=Hibiscus sabdariffa TaxID=183260 RepID=A0ABR2NGY7_9ROSI
MALVTFWLVVLPSLTIPLNGVSLQGMMLTSFPAKVADYVACVGKPLLSRALVSCFPPSLSDSRIVPLSNVFPSIVGHIPRWNLDRPFLTGRFHQEQLVWELMRRIFLRIRSVEENEIDSIMELQIEFFQYEHPVVLTVEAQVKYVGNMGGVLSKNLFLKDKKHKYYVVSALVDTKVDLKDRLGLGKGGLRMAPEEAVGELLQGSLNKANIEEWK